METKTFDARGMACPLPVVNAKKESEEMTNGGTLIILVDNEIAVQNLTKFGNSKGFTVSSEKKTKKDFTVTFQIPENSTTSTPAAECRSRLHPGFQKTWSCSRPFRQYHGKW